MVSRLKLAIGRRIIPHHTNLSIGLLNALIIPWVVSLKISHTRLGKVEVTYLL